MNVLRYVPRSKVVTDRSRFVAQRVAASQLSAIKDMAMRSARVEGAVSLAWGLPSFSTPDHIRLAAADGLAHQADIGKYTLPNGLAELRQCAALHHRNRTGVDVDPERNVLITAGNMQGMNALFHSTIDAGDEVIMTDPGFASHRQQIQLFGGVPVPWPLNESEQWRLQIETLPDLITPRSKAIVLVTPSNPTGTIFRKDDLLAIGDIAQKHGLLVVVDDPYSDFVYDEAQECFNLASERSLFDQMAYLFTFSKRYAMSGWRLAYTILPDWLRQQMLKVHDATVICCPHISQVAGVAALRGDQHHLREFTSIFAERRQLICERLDRVPHIFEYVQPEGGYYVFPRIVARHENSFEFCLRLLHEAKVSVTPGSAFGAVGEHHVRLAYCVDDQEINAAFDRLEVWQPNSSR